MELLPLRKNPTLKGGVIIVIILSYFGVNKYPGNISRNKVPLFFAGGSGWSLADDSKKCSSFIFHLMLMKRLLLLILFLAPFVLRAQIVTTYAGNGLSSGPIGDGGMATSANIGSPSRGIFDKQGNFYFGCNSNRIRKIDPAGIITTIAGNGNTGFAGDGGQATAAELNGVGGVHFDHVGNIYFADVENFRIRRIDKSTGIITTIAGNGTLGSTGDGELATASTLDDPQDICIDSHDNIYIAEYFSSRVRKINALGFISNFAGVNGMSGYSGDGGLADTSRIGGGVESLYCDNNDNIYMAANSRVLKVNSGGIISTVAGTGTSALFNGDDISATSANVDPYAVTKDYDGNLYIAEYHNFRVRMVDGSGIIHTVAGNGIEGYSGDGTAAISAEFDFPCGIVFDSCDNLYISDNGNNRVRKVSFNPLCLPLAIDNVKEETVNIYPNPTSNELQIDNVPKPTNYNLHNIVGATLQHGTLKEGSNSISLSLLPTGMYLLELIDDEGNRVVRKVVKE